MFFDTIKRRHAMSNEILCSVSAEICGHRTKGSRDKANIELYKCLRRLFNA